jgi:azurin
MRARASLAALAALLIAAPLVSAQTKPKPSAPRVVLLTGTDNMKFTPARIEAKRGEKLRISLKSVGTLPKIAMSHNFILLKKGVDALALANASAMARATDFLAPEQKKNVLVATALAGNGETVMADFTAPTVPGEYTFICTFTGHFQAGMKGVLVVK